jgi:predicted Rossmann fold nucleotide-binding protein DprA/Smf involved in DNA uptake
MRLAIVGSRTFVVPTAIEYAAEVIRYHLVHNDVTEVISGGAPGIDQLAVRIANSMGIPIAEFFPANQQWSPDGFCERNKRIVHACDGILAIRCHQAKTFGSGWTLNYAMSMGKPVVGSVVL